MVGTLILSHQHPAGCALSRRDLLGKEVNISVCYHRFDVSYPMVDSNLTQQWVCRTCRYILGNGCSIASSCNIIDCEEHSSITCPEGMWKQLKLMDAETFVISSRLLFLYQKAIIAVIGLWTVGIWNSWFNAFVIYLIRKLATIAIDLRRFIN